ncbi:TonB-dependent siderophore receptor [uncultured Thalassospira sp.]|uniref:TonB-dependent siderophore receptor n=1 Tax=uncultured Thalassospira sp. TaxID=404382 RepID=UPI0030DADBCE|tara:strand:+ start:578 stop:2785 length:2208 start_codon:yes stop_codon:yes gene_type:complete
MKQKYHRLCRVTLVAASIGGLTVGRAAQADDAMPKQQTAQTAQDAAVESDDGVTLAPVTVTADREMTDTAREVNGYQPVATTTATRMETPLIDVPQAVNVVSSKVIEDQRARSLDEALANVSGISQTNTLGGTQDAIIRRGFGSNRDGSILTNGLKSALPRSFNITTDRVEVLKGPASSLYGILDPGGMINLVTKKPQDTFGGNVYGSLSSFGGGTTGFDVTGPVAEGSPLSFRLLGEHEKTDYWRNFGDIKHDQIAPSLRWQGDDTDVTVSYFHETYSVPFDRGTVFDPNTGHAVAVDPEIRFDEPYNITKGKTDTVQLDVDHDLGDGWNIGFDYGYSRNTYSDNQARLRSYDPATGNLVRRADATQGSTIIQHSARLDVTGKADIGGYRNDILFGSSYDNSDTLRTDMIRCGNTGGFNIYNPVYGTLPACSTVSAPNSDQTEKLSTVSFYGQDSLHLSDQWILVGGLRFQYYDILAGKGRPFKTNTERYGHEVIPNGGIVYKLTPDVSFYGNAAKTFRPQSSIGSYVGNIAPEEGVSYEIGTKLQIADGLTSNIAVYTSEKQNVAYSEVIGGETVVKAAGLVRARGLEVDLAGALSDHLDLIASYGFTDTRIMEDPDYQGKRLPNVARHTGSLFLAYDFENAVPGASKFRAGGGIRAVGKRPGDNNNSYDLPGYATADLFAAYTVDAARPVTFQLNLKNIFDKVYYTSSIGSNTLSNQIGEPFNAVLSVKVDF